MASIQTWPLVTVNRIVQTLIYRLALHPLMVDPPLVDAQGSPIRVNKYRNFDGLELQNPQGLTISVFPYHYAKGDAGTALTVDSNNAGVTFKEGTLGGDKGDLTGYHTGRANIVVKAHAFGISKEGSEEPDLVKEQNTFFEYNYIEWMLRQYMEVIAAILRDDLRKLPRFPDRAALLANSFVHHIDYPTSSWTAGSNLVLHSASLMWHADYYVPIRWRAQPFYVPAEMSDGNLVVGSLNDSLGVSYVVYYDTIHFKYINPAGVVIDRAALTDPETSIPYTTLDADLMTLIDSAPSGLTDLSYYYKLKTD